MGEILKKVLVATLDAIEFCRKLGIFLCRIEIGQLDTVFDSGYYNAPTEKGICVEEQEHTTAKQAIWMDFIRQEQTNPCFYTETFNGKRKDNAQNVG